MRKQSSCRAGALASASSCVKPGFSTSSRITLLRLPMGWNVGSTPSRSYSVMGLRLSMMSLRSTVICFTSSSSRWMRVYSAMPRTSRSVTCCAMHTCFPVSCELSARSRRAVHGCFPVRCELSYYTRTRATRRPPPHRSTRTARARHLRFCVPENASCTPCRVYNRRFAAKAGVGLQHICGCI